MQVEPAKHYNNQWVAAASAIPDSSFHVFTCKLSVLEHERMHLLLKKMLDVFLRHWRAGQQWQF